MRNLTRITCAAALAAAAALLAGGGCRNGGFGQQAQVNEIHQQYMAQLNEVQRRAYSLDANNVDLHQQLARSEQHAQVLAQDLAMVRGQLAETSQRLAAAESARTLATERLAALEASATQRGGAIITANSSLRQDLQTLNIPGLDVRHEQGAVHVEIPSDRLFQPGTANLHQAAYPLLDQVATAIKSRYAAEPIAIEGHTDSDPVVGAWGNNQQLSAAQANAVFQILTVRHQMQPGRFQLFGRGAAQPVVSNGTPQGKARNRRVELVVQTGG
ncbi:MAG: OmpA family protein [Planctomycetales bacterium]|nr:OmpA family protein [Planctomycetales bacterium]